jgi:hypothetical protein
MDLEAIAAGGPFDMVELLRELAGRVIALEGRLAALVKEAPAAVLDASATEAAPEARKRGR